jgi:hypothetical protein
VRRAGRFAVAVVTWSWRPNDRPPDWLAHAGWRKSCRAVIWWRHRTARRTVTSFSRFVRADAVRHAPNLEEPDCPAEVTV